MTKLKLIIFCLLMTSVISAQNVISYNFADDSQSWSVRKGKVEIAEHEARNTKALKLSPNTQISIDFPLQSSSSYLLTVWMRTESGADDISMQINNLGKNNISVTTALATWTKFERVVNLSENQKSAELEFLFGNSQGNTYAWIGEIVVKRTGDYKEIVYTGIPPAPKREIKTDLGIEMQPDDKIQWMLDDKIGLFIHWGLYSDPVKGNGTWKITVSAPKSIGN